MEPEDNIRILDEQDGVRHVELQVERHYNDLRLTHARMELDGSVLLYSMHTYKGDKARQLYLTRKAVESLIIAYQEYTNTHTLVDMDELL